MTPTPDNQNPPAPCSENAVLRAALGIHQEETVPEQKPQFGSILVDRAGSRRRIAPATENEEKIAQELADMTAQRDKWKASHDNQVNLRRTLMDRPDLKERAKLVSELAAQRDELQSWKDTLLVQRDAKDAECEYLRRQIQEKHVLKSVYDRDVSKLRAEVEGLQSKLNDSDLAYQFAIGDRDKATAALDAVRKAIPVSRIDEKSLAESVESLALALRDACQESDA